LIHAVDLSVSGSAFDEAAELVCGCPNQHHLCELAAPWLFALCVHHPWKSSAWCLQGPKWEDFYEAKIQASPNPKGWRC
jgi:hypothetical protein